MIFIINSENKIVSHCAAFGGILEDGLSLIETSNIEINIDSATGKTSYTPAVVTPELIAAVNTEKLKAQAKQLILDNEHKWNNQILWAGYTQEGRDVLTEYYLALLAVINGESSVIPAVPDFNS